MLVIKQFGPVTYAMGTLQEILAGTGIAAKVRALPNDVSGCTLEMSASGWVGCLGVFASDAAMATATGGNYTNLVTGGVTVNIAGVRYTYQGAVVGWVASREAKITRIGVVGDSIDVYGGGIGLALASVSGGRIYRAATVANPGDTSTDQLSKLSGLARANLDYVTVKLGTNDAYKSGKPYYVPLDTYSSNLEAIGNYILSIGATPVFITPPPNSSSGSAYIPEYTRAMEVLCARRKWFISRRWRQLNNGTSAYISGGSYDNIHPYTHWLTSEAVGLLNDMSNFGLFPGVELLRCEKNSGDPSGKFSNALFLTDTNSDGIADSVSILGSGVASLVPAAFGNRQNVAVTASAGNNGVGVSLSGLTVGKKYRLTFDTTISVSSGTMRFVTYNPCSGAGIYANPSATQAMTVVSADGTVTIAYTEEFIATAASGTVNTYDPGSGASFVLGIQEFQCWDLATLGLA